ncbi:hypothetical protein PV326_010075 [Microctonus aethiopoides]|nr:hypothetical protein PV326_010075 [Microctonus aethiopoides]
MDDEMIGTCDSTLLSISMRKSQTGEKQQLSWGSFLIDAYFTNGSKNKCASLAVGRRKLPGIPVGPQKPCHPPLIQWRIFHESLINCVRRANTILEQPYSSTLSSGIPIKYENY